MESGLFESITSAAESHHQKSRESHPITAQTVKT